MTVPTKKVMCTINSLKSASQSWLRTAGMALVLSANSSRTREMPSLLFIKIHTIRVHRCRSQKSQDKLNVTKVKPNKQCKDTRKEVLFWADHHFCHSSQGRWELVLAFPVRLLLKSTWKVSFLGPSGLGQLTKKDMSG